VQLFGHRRRLRDHSSDPWDATGWFFIPHGTCGTVIAGDMTGQRFHWTAASAGPTWGDNSSTSTETWLVPNFVHTNMCDATIPSACSNSGASCRTSPHWAVSSTGKNFEIDVEPNNTFTTNLKLFCENPRVDCVASPKCQ
jgi:hypothetical protein